MQNAFHSNAHAESQTLLFEISGTQPSDSAYFAAGKFGLRLAFFNLNATVVWPPTGIARAAVLIHGDYVWIGIFLGAFLVNL